MGASGWWYRREHQPDVGAALAELQREVFAKGEYYKSWEEHPGLLESWADELPMMIESNPEAFPAELFTQARIERMAQGGDPPTIDDARLWAMDSGTHSILDVFGVSETPRFGKVSPLTDEEREEILRASEPTVEQIEAAEDDLYALTKRGQGRYLVGHDATGAPAALFFFGISGD